MVTRLVTMTTTRD